VIDQTEPHRGSPFAQALFVLPQCICTASRRVSTLPHPRPTVPSRVHCRSGRQQGCDVGEYL